jgi:predicted permease
MPFIWRVRSLWRNLVRRQRVERDLDEELQTTLDLLAAEKMRAGLPLSQARRAAAIELRIEQVKEQVRDVRTGAALETLAQDVRYAWRHIRRSPGFALAAIVTLALAIGANTAAFSMVNALMLRQLPIEDPDGLIAIAPRTSRGLPRSTPVSAVDHLSGQGPLDPVCGYLGGIVLPVLANNIPVQTLTTFITGRCFETFGVSPILGRRITDADAPINGPGAHVAVISHRMWTNAFAADPAVLGKSLQVNNVDVAIIGVLPLGFVGLEVDYGVDVFTTFDSVLPATGARRQLASYLLGRLRSGVTLAQAQAELETRWPALVEAVLPPTLPPSEREQLRDSTLHLERLGTGTSRNRERYSQPLTLILGLTTLLLLLACVNLGGLLLARVTARSGELSVRLALGGTKWRIAQQMLIETLMLSVSGAALAIPLAFAIATGLASLMPPSNVPYTMSFTPDLRVLAITSLVGLAVGIGMSALPIWVAMRRRAGIRMTMERTIVSATSRWGRAMLVAQVSLSVVMLVGAALMTRSLYLLQSADLGIRTANILNVKVFTLPNATYNRGQRIAYYPPLLEKISALPGVRSVAMAAIFPRTPIGVRGSPITFVGEEPTGLEARGDSVSPGFFATMGIRLLAGRDVAWSDTLQTRRVAVVSESLARALSPDANVLERQVRVRTLPVDQEMVIVGVVADATQGDPRSTRPFVVYRPALQIGTITAFNPNFLIDTTDPTTTASAIRQILHDAGQDYAQEIIALDDLLARAPATERMSASVATGVAILAIALALIGVHGSLAYAVSRRRREIGVRVAVGATPSTVALGFLREAITVTTIGIALGLPLAFVAAQSVKSLMFGITETDAVTFAAVTVFFLAVGAAAGVAPARRAARVDPIAALRSE